MTFEERVESFKAEYRELVTKHQMDFVAQLRVTVDGIMPVISVIDTSRQPSMTDGGGE